MIFPENQVRNFYVVTKALPSGTDWDQTTTNPGGAKAYKKGNTLFFKYKDANEKLITTDIIRTKNIRDIRISKPEGFNGRVWGISVDVTNMQAGDVCLLHFDLGNIFGFGEGEKFYYEYPIVFTSSMTAAQLLQKIEKVLADVLKYNKVMASVFESIAYNSTDAVLYLKEADQDYNGILGYYPHTVNVKIDAEAVRTTATGAQVLAPNPFTVEDVNDPNATGTYTNAPAINSKTNSYKIAAMERYFSKVRADLYGYMGYPDVNPSTMILPTADTDTYYTLDIKYYTQLSGVNNQNSEKEMTFASKDPKYLLRLIEDVIDTSDPHADATAISGLNNNESFVYTVTV
jgi:hypothetical protein